MTSLTPGRIAEIHAALRQATTEYLDALMAEIEAWAASEGDSCAPEPTDQ